MSYAEERIYTASVRLDYAEKGFKESAKTSAELILNATSADEIESIAKNLLLDKSVLDNVRDHYEYIKKQYIDEVTV